MLRQAFLKFSILLMLALGLVLTTTSLRVSAQTSKPSYAYGEVCHNDKTFFGIPVWYKYLKDYEEVDSGGACVINLSKPAAPNGDTVCDSARKANSTCVRDIGAAVFIALAIVDILLHVIGIMVVGFIIFGGTKYVLSRGEPERTKQAQSTILNALIGLVITIIAASVVAFVGKRLGG